ncbi:MAG: hypothetical protein KDB53_04280 [Planctomycetes bacterium]|nr:hypothetical protein [Planctomycetota bacterium]
MTEPRPPKKNEALVRIRSELPHCSKCGQPYDSVDANSHQVNADDPGSARFYFQFIHGRKECIDFTFAREFDAWLEKAKEKSQA